MTWRRDSSRHPHPKANIAEEQRCEAIVRDLVGALECRDVARISGLLTADVRMVVDTGGAVSDPAPHAEHGRPVTDRILRLVAQHPTVALALHSVNGAPAILLRDDGTLTGVISVGMESGAISHLWVVLNPHKLVAFVVD